MRELFLDSLLFQELIEESIVEKLPRLCVDDEDDIVSDNELDLVEWLLVVVEVLEELCFV